LLPSLLSTGWLQERIWALFHNQTEINRLLKLYFNSI